jgi:LysR family transcriptional regulator, hydrogen peroxide-inducible genes activator
MSEINAGKLRGFELRQLECFCTVAQAGSFTRAADLLGIAQPSLSEQIKKLEQALGSALFERLSRRIELTPLGHALLPKARALLEDAAALPQYLEAVQEGVRGVLRIGAIPTILPYFLAPALPAFVTRYPGVDLHLREATTDELLSHLQEGLLDIAVMSLPVDGSGLVMCELFRENLFLAVPETHALANDAEVRLRRVSDERLLILKDGHCLREETLTVCDRARARFTAQFEADQFASIFELIRAGFGVSIVPEMARQSAERCRLIPLAPKAIRKIGYVRLERRYVSKTVDAFTSFLRELGDARKRC